MQDAVGIEQRQAFRRIAYPGRDLVVAFEAPEEERKSGGTHGHKNLGVAVARDVAAREEPRHCDDGVADAADGVGEAVIVHAGVAGAVIHIHPSYDAGDTRVNDYGLANAVGRISDAIVAVARLLASGHVTRYRDAKIFVPMGAAGLPFLLGRLKRNRTITPGIADPAEGLALLYTDSILHDPRALRFVVEIMGADRVMMGSDMPFPIGDEEPAKIVTAAGLKPDEVASITGGLAQKLFRVG